MRNLGNRSHPRPQSGPDAAVLVELPGTFRPVAAIALRYTAEHGEQLVVLADL